MMCEGERQGCRLASSWGGRWRKPPPLPPYQLPHRPTTLRRQAATEAAELEGGGALFLATLLMLVFRRKYPRWWFDWHLELTRFTTRVGAYVLLLRDEYPSTDEAQAVRLDLDYPDAAADLNRFLPIVKWLLAIPHYIVLIVLWVVAIVVTVLAWFAILITGRYPRPLFDFVLGVSRWSLRVEAYMWLLTTDRYPPFRLEP